MIDAAGLLNWQYRQVRLTSVYQPIHDLTSGHAIGAQALVRTATRDGSGLSPWNLFSRAVSPEELVMLDRRCRTIHALNFFGRVDLGKLLFLCVHEKLLGAVPANHGQAFRAIVDELGFDVKRFVIELPELLNADPAILPDILASYRRNGFAVLVNATATDHLKALAKGPAPDYIKLDVRRLTGVGELQAAIRLAGKLSGHVIAKRVETAAEFAYVTDSGATHVQGHVLGKPQTTPDLSRSVQAITATTLSEAERSGLRQLQRQWIG